jgi:hypothetical protein
MGHPIPQQHPAVVLRSHYRHVKALLAVAMLAVAALAVAVVLLATDPGDAASQRAGASPAQVESMGAQSTERRVAVHGKASPPRYDGGPSEGTVGLGH